VDGFSSAISGVGSAIGRYFSVVSFIPSLFLVGFTYALVESGAWDGGGAPDWARSANAFTHVGDLVGLTLVSVAIGVALHPIQFALVQFFEGYWGTSRLAQRARVARMRQHSRRMTHLEWGPRANAEVRLSKEAAGKTTLEKKERIELLSVRNEGRRLRRNYPDNEHDVMPTRLGNVLRRYERLAGYQYELDAVDVIRHVAFVAPPQHVEYLTDQRQLLDLSVRMCVTSVLATLVAIAFLWHHGPWLAIALAPYVIAYLSYRGAVVVAHEYGAALCTIIDLDRFALYDSLRMPRPGSTKAEQSTNKQLMELLRQNQKVDLPYAYPPAQDEPDKNAAGT
jgi:hypothetical protein